MRVKPEAPESTLPTFNLETNNDMITPEQKQLKHYHRWSIYLMRKEGSTRAEFNHYWEQTHGDFLATLSISQKYIVRYDQMYNETDDDYFEYNGKKYDGIAVCDFLEKEDCDRMMADDEWIRLANPDTDAFVEREKIVKSYSKVNRVM